MNTTSPHARAYRRLGYLAIAHAVALFVLFASSVMWDKSGIQIVWLVHLWVGLATLWFLWPLVLILHRGRSLLRSVLFIIIGTLVMLPSLRIYDSEAPLAFGLPEFVRMNPWSMWTYFHAYRLGHAEAKKDIAAGILAIEEYGFGAGGAVKILRERYQIEVRVVAGCVVDEKIVGHAAGYNKVSEAEIDRRVGLNRVAEAQEEGAKLANEEVERQRQFAKDLARRLSSLAPDSKIMTESIWPYVDQQLSNDPAAEQELAPLVHAVEKYLVEHVPSDAPTFKLQFLVKATPTNDPSFEVSSTGSPPRPVWENIYNNLQTIAVPRSNRGSLTVSLYFIVRDAR